MYAIRSYYASATNGRERANSGLSAACSVAVVSRAIAEAERKIQDVELSFRNGARSELSDTMAKLNSLSEGSAALADRVKHAEVRSPMHGTVKRLLVNTIGGVVQPGKDVAEA